MGVVLNLAVTFETTGACPTCGIEWAVPSNYLRVKKEKKETLYCPNGHSMAYTETEVDRLKKQLEAAEANTKWERGRRERAERETSAARGLATKARKELIAVKERVGNGVCPCCHRTFINLQRHMGTKHPDYKAERTDEGDSK
jgi:hypothetical protein